MTNYYRGIEDLPYHLSVGAVVRNEQGLIAVHHFDKLRDLNGTRRDYEDFYILMRGTLEPNETCEQTLARGLMEEFGMKAEVITYLGSLVAPIGPEKYIQKTTLYFECRLIEMHEEWRDPNDEERDSTIEWHDSEFLIEKMKEQAVRTEAPDLDESAVITRLRRHDEPAA